VITTAEIALNLAKTISALNLAAAGLDAITPFYFQLGLAYRAIQIPLLLVCTAQA
jgi:hypothetical protein